MLFTKSERIDYTSRIAVAVVIALVLAVILGVGGWIVLVVCFFILTPLTGGKNRDSVILTAISWGSLVVLLSAPLWFFIF